MKSNEEITIHFGGALLDGQEKQIYFLACIGQFSKFSTRMIYNNATATTIERFLSKYIVFQGVAGSGQMPNREHNQRILQ